MAEAILARRQRERTELLATAEAFATALAETLAVRAVVVHGSVARGDFNRWSDIDVLVVAENLPDRLLDRLDAVSPWPARVQPLVWTPAEFAQRAERADPIAIEARKRGVWLAGEPGDVYPGAS